ncbi:YidC/Oxa1 family membrane protein insertase [Actinomarinicola tropica]|uniref:Membrane protein insertase YidC n=1 Tax=Actinomarinicola tropica TaxID=2789776 RepID=A0A5Q2RJE2_9ACTN|nr:YidC/Oxa1 family membrane protein insertase [Actinomarinicola tropica]QGG96899.1 membrane protein insertase YidC [Actinomarinicola tropica]
MFDVFFDAIAGLLALFYEIPGIGYGGAIALLTIVVMVLVTPLTLKGTRSMMTMQALAPEMKRIQQQYADDRVKMNEELLAFYKENQINPVGGCLPLLLQMPVFIILYQVINGLTRRGADGTFDPKYLSEDSALYQALHGSTEMLSLGIDLSESAANALQDSFVHGLPYIAMIIAVAASSYIQQKQISGRNPNAEMPQQQKILLRVMPIFFAFISFNFAAALVVYFLVSNLYRIGQQAYISRTLYGPDSVLAQRAREASIEATATEKPAKPAKRTKAKDATASKDARSSKETRSGKDDAGTTGPKKARPTSGRVTPPKSAGGPSRGTPPQRRKKKRS